MKDWRDGGFDSDMSRVPPINPVQAPYMGGANFDVQLDDVLFNRMLKLKDLRTPPQGNDLGKLYLDGANKKYKMWLGKTEGFVDILYTSTSTSSTSTSTTSTSTS